MDGRIFALWLAACVLLVAGCTSSSGSSTSASAGGSSKLPPLGACHDPLPTSVLSMKPSDATAAVACSSPHTTETAYIFQLRRPTRQQAGLYADACRQKMLTYLGFGPSGPPAPAPDYPIRYRWYIPTPSQVADGQSWARCDNGTWADTRFTQVAERTQSLKDVISHNPSALWLCLDQRLCRHATNGSHPARSRTVPKSPH
jgi:hypothetical protein